TGTATPKSFADYKLVGAGPARKDIPQKVAGTYTYIQHIELPGMLHGRVVRPRGQRAYGAGAKVIWIDLRSVMHISGARILQKGDFVGVVAPNEWDAIRASRDIKIMWAEPRQLPDDGEIYQQMRAERTDDKIVAQSGDVDAAFAGAAQSVEFSCHAPYQSHATFAPNCALADVKRNSALVIATSQDIYNLRRELAPILNLPEPKIRVQFADGSGTYGHSLYDDVAMAAAILSQLAKKPVRVQFMRHDEHGWDTYGPAHVGEVRVAADKEGKLVGYQYDGWQHNWSLIETSQQLALGTKWAEWPLFVSQQVNPLVCGGQYKIESTKLINHHVPGGTYLRGAWLRSPLDLSFAFTSEQAIDELAHRLKKDPYELRRANIADERWLGVLDGAARAADWSNKKARAKPTVYGTVIGRGIGLGTHLASWGGAVADIEVNKETGVVRIKHLYGALDAGLVVNPANVEAQIMGQLVQTASRMLFEEVTFDTLAVTSLDWSSYKVMRMQDCPEVTPVIVQRMEKPSSGAGEEVMAAAAAAIANAFFDATGKRMREFPFTPKRVLKALAT
ncbi:MAG: molybdopterin cofactor-binding domain-containing protein, partial [Alphaproteobacteria bacterium]